MLSLADEKMELAMSHHADFTLSCCQLAGGEARLWPLYLHAWGWSHEMSHIWEEILPRGGFFVDVLFVDPCVVWWCCDFVCTIRDSVY